MKCRFHIEAEDDPQTAARVLGLVTVRNELPEKFSFERNGTQMRVTLEMLCRDELASRLLGHKFQSIPTVNHVTRAMFPTTAVGNVYEPPAPAFWI